MLIHDVQEVSSFEVPMETTGLANLYEAERAG